MAEKTRILFTGDSITDANRTTVTREWEAVFLRDPSIPEGHRQELVDAALGCGYPLLVAAQLGGEHPGRYEVLNRGVSGDRVVDLDARVKVDCIRLRPHVLSVLIGVNDVWHEITRGNGVSAAKFSRVYQGMLEEITRALPGLRLILMEPFVLPGPATRDHWEVFLREVDLRREVVRQLAGQYGAACIDTQALFDQAAAGSRPEDWAADGVHPTPAGHWLLAQAWLRCFEGL